jgi:hypothetical protein
MTNGVQCHLEDEFLPNVTHASVRQFLLSRFDGDAVSRDIAASRAGWYLQQILKLGAVLALASLSKHFVIWDWT